jgi:hypothetical protein
LRGLSSTIKYPGTRSQGIPYRELGMGVAQTAVEALKGGYEPRDEPMTALRKTFGW